MTVPNNPLPVPPGVSPTVVSSIRQASRATSIDFGVLMAQAKEESGFRVDAKASGSSATGLFQFINSTWLSLVQRFGEKYGVGDLARQIATDSTGQANVADPAVRERILGLRKDASLSAALAAEYARANKGEIERALGHPAGNAGLYLAHFLGAAGATALLKAVTQNGDALGAALLPSTERRRDLSLLRATDRRRGATLPDRRRGQHGRAQRRGSGRARLHLPPGLPWPAAKPAHGRHAQRLRAVGAAAAGQSQAGRPPGPEPARDLGRDRAPPGLACRHCRDVDFRRLALDTHLHIHEMTQHVAAAR